ncbi:phage terminase large subunit [Paenibacillus sp. M1]|uniref:Phage terminase large subunit n=1 Tax=Paenibacillus haidiansis TaxID=1574488 RepID=A0ABU7VQU7_9BACL
MIKLDDYIRQLEDDDEAKEQIQNIAYQRDLFERYVCRSEEHAEYRRSLWQAYQDGDELTGPNGLRKKLGAIDLEYFGRAYLPHYFVRESPKFHGELDRIWTQGVMKGLNPITDKKKISRAKGCHRGTAAPRGHAKSTNFTFKDTLHAVVYEYKHYPIILSDSSDQAEGFLTDIKTELEDNAAIIEDFGSLKGKVWKGSVLLTSTDIKVEAIGSGKKIRGRRHRNWRPDLLVLDDIENDENVNTPEQRKKLESWFYKAVSKAGDTYTDIVYIGTILHYDSLLSKVLKNPSYQCVTYRGVISFAKDTSLWDAWEVIYNDLDNPAREEDALAYFEENREAMLEGTEVLWEDKLSYYDLMIIKLSEGDASFNSEIQNDPIDPDSCTFNEEWFDFYDDDPSVDFSAPKFILVAANDPSLGKNKKSDTSSIIVIAKDTVTGYMYVAEASIEKRHPDVIIDDAIEMSKRAKRDLKKSFYRFGVETVQFQHYFKDVLVKKSAEAGEYLPIEEIQSRENKFMRIESLQPLIKNRYLKFSRKHKTLLQQLKEFPMGRNDDGPDGLEMAVRLALSIKTTNKVDYKSVISRALKFRRGGY